MTAFEIVDARDRAEWLVNRTAGIGASDIAAIVGESPWQTPMQVWASKVDPEPVESEPDEAMRWGTMMETLILDDAANRHLDDPLKRRGVLLRATETPWLIATPDALTANDEPVEAKKSDDWDWPDGPPRHYVLQVLWQMAVTGAQRGYIVALHRSRGTSLYTVERDGDEIGRLLEAGAWFWGLVEAGEPPPVEAEDNAFLASLWPDHVESPVEVDEALAAELRDARAEFDAAKARRDLAEANLKAAMEEADTAVVGQEVVATWRTQESRRVDTKRLRAERPEVAAEFEKVTTSRVFRATRGDR